MSSCNSDTMDIVKRKKELEAVLENSYSPYSEFKVAASIKTSKGEFFSGVNIENSSYSLTMCAEASAIAAMISSNGIEAISDVVIINNSEKACPPCGACLQRLIEFGVAQTNVYLGVAKSDEIKKYKLKDLIPLQFNRDYLNKS